MSKLQHPLPHEATFAHTPVRMKAGHIMQVSCCQLLKEVAGPRLSPQDAIVMHYMWVGVVQQAQLRRGPRDGAMIANTSEASGAGQTYSFHLAADG